jgi:hypothetical protein
MEERPQFAFRHSLFALRGFAGPFWLFAVWVRTLVILSDEHSEESKDPYSCNSPSPRPSAITSIH